MSSNKNLNRFRLPWAAWHEGASTKSSQSAESGMDITFPNSWNVRMLELPKLPQVRPESIALALDNPTAVSPLRDIVGGTNKKIAIAIDDLTRPACLKPVIDVLLDKLEEIGIDNTQIQIIAAIAAHKPLEAEEIARKIGNSAACSINVINHSMESKLEDVQLASGKTVPINQQFLRSDIKIVIGTVMPHFYAGYSGGAKMILPGLAGIDAISNTHKSVLMGLSGKLRQVDGNRFRQRIESVAAAVGVDYSIQLVVGRNREIVGIFTGDIISSHRAAVKHAEQIYLADFPKNLDIAILNAYPKDTELLQSENAYIAYRSARDLVKPGGTVVLTSACSEGLGVHGLFQPGKSLYREPRPYGFLEGRHLIGFTPGVTRNEFYSMFSSSYSFHGEWQNVMEELKQRHLDSCKVGIISCASLQMAREAV